MNYFSLLFFKSSFRKNVRLLSLQKFFYNSLIMSGASRKEHVYISNTLSSITKWHILLYLRAKNSLNRENSLCGHYFSTQGRVVRKPVNVNPGLNVNCSIIFSCLKMLFTPHVWCSLRLLQLKTTGQTI